MFTDNSNADEIQNAVQSLGLTSERFSHVSDDREEEVYESIRRHFVPSGPPGCLWWEHFPVSTGVQFPNGDGYRHLAAIVPEDHERVWFIAQDHFAPEYSVWEAEVRDIQTVIAECYAFKYYLIQQQFRWLICENHHDYVIAVGDGVEARLNNICSSCIA